MGRRGSSVTADKWQENRAPALTWQLIGGAAEHNAQTRLVVHRAARFIGLAGLQAVGQHQCARQRVQLLRWRR